jgi:hypothetical protein
MSSLDMQADFTIHDGWGNHIDWNVDDWSRVDFDKDLLGVYGHISPRPRKGQTLLGEFVRSFILFEFVSVEYCSDPPDMFFGRVKAIKQTMKDV